MRGSPRLDERQHRERDGGDCDDPLGVGHPLPQRPDPRPSANIGGRSLLPTAFPRHESAAHVGAMWQSPRVKLAASIGLVLNVIGTSLAWSALWRGARKHADWSMLLPRVAAVREWFLVKVLRRTRKVSTHRGTAWLTANSTLIAGGIASPAADAPMDEQVAYFRKQVMALHTRIDQQRQEIAGEISVVRDDVTDARREAQEAVREVRKDVREIATGTVTQQMLGLFLVGLGTVIGAVPVVLGWT